ncbi:hypothetical protein, partial [Rahnella sp. ChDrAdgB13]|uniref:hypothetical protein n=1 Tax=Rahnella sp. ChDrAdgB13 TaxID=1850581 RepID=UPI001AD887D9
YGLPEEVGDEGSFYLNPIYSTKPQRPIKNSIAASILIPNNLIKPCANNLKILRKLMLVLSSPDSEDKFCP